MSWFKLGSRKTKDSGEIPGGDVDTNTGAADTSEQEQLTSPSVQQQTARIDASEAAGGQSSTTTGKWTRKVPDALADLFLVMEEHLNPLELEDSRQLLAAFSERPPLIERFSKSLQEPQDLAKAIAAIEGLEISVLSVANSPAFSLNQNVQNVDTLIHVMGLTAVKGLIFQSLITPYLWLETAEQKSAYMRIWQSTYVATVSASAFAKLLEFEKPSVHATRALLLGAGDLALISACPELASSYAPDSLLLDRTAAQQHSIMANTAVLSSLLARQWGLADQLYSALRHSSTPLTWPPESNSRSVDKQQESLILYLACRIGDAVAYHGLRDVRKMRLRNGGSQDLFFVPEYIDKLQLQILDSAFDEPQTRLQIQRIIDAVAPSV